MWKGTYNIWYEQGWAENLLFRNLQKYTQFRSIFAKMLAYTSFCPAIFFKVTTLPEYSKFKINKLGVKMEEKTVFTKMSLKISWILQIQKIQNVFIFELSAYDSDVIIIL
jgi:hypothetical protein